MIMTIHTKLYRVQRETYKFIAKYYRRNQTYDSQTETLRRKNKKLVHNHLSTYAEKLAKINPILINQLTFHILPSDHRPVTITFTTNNDSDNDFKLSLYQKYRIQYENWFIISKTTPKWTQPMKTRWKDELVTIIDDNYRHHLN